MLKNVAIIPARGGSKRIPKKNIIEFLGKPMIAWTIEAAIQSNKFDKVIVSTDNQEIASVASHYGAEIPFLRETDFDDMTPVSTATLNHAIRLQKYWGEEIKTVAQLMPNCPLRTYKDLETFIDKFDKLGSPFLLSCFKFGWMNPWWSFKMSETGDHEFMFPKALTMRSQDLDDLYCPTGSIWVAKLSSLVKDGTFYGKGHRFSEIPWESAVDIDDSNDLEFARKIASN